MPNLIMVPRRPLRRAPYHIPEEYIESKAADFKSPHIPKAPRGTLKLNAKIFCVDGLPGTGKTTAILEARAAILNDYPQEKVHIV